MRLPFLRVALSLSVPALVLGLHLAQAQGSDVVSSAQGPHGTSQECVVPLPRLGDLLKPLARQPRGRIVLVLDGDSLRLADRRTLRLACVDAPDMALSSPLSFAHQELRQENFYVEPGTAVTAPRPLRAADQAYAAEAHAQLKRRALKRSVQLMAPKSKRDPQGRLVADAVLEDGTTLSTFLVAHGLGYVVRDPDYPPKYLDALVALQNEAMAAHRGFWGILLGLEAARQPWIGNSETHLFYASQDVRGQQVKPRMRVYFGTLMDAFSAGFAPASSRDFWPAAR